MPCFCQHAGDVANAAILTPYRGQVRALEALLRAASAQLPALAAMDIAVSSVDAYQGREADVVVFSTVRCNPSGAIGFVSDPRRLNVAITRARRGLVVVGSADTLQRSSSQDWRAYMRWLQEQVGGGEGGREPPARRRHILFCCLPGHRRSCI